MKAQVYQAIARSLDAYKQCAKEPNHPWTEKHRDNIERIIKDHMPHGSGFELDYEKSSATKLVFHTAFHHMDDNGSYCGWTDHTVTIEAELLFGFTFKLLPYLDDSGKLTSYAWPGGYPVFYIDTECNAICPDCANKDAITPDLQAAGVNWEDASLYCDECCKRIESAYAENERKTTDNGQ